VVVVVVVAIAAAVGAAEARTVRLDTGLTTSSATI
jgi:hypothetical protein